MITFDTEAAIFLKTAGGGQSQSTIRCYTRPVNLLKRYLTEEWQWTPARPVADLTPEMLQEFPAWLLEQTYQRSELAAPRLLAENSRAFYLIVTGRFVRFLVLRKRLPGFDFETFLVVKEGLAKSTNAKPKPVAQKIPSREIVEALVNAARRPLGKRYSKLVWLRNIAIVEALRASGMRVGEVVSLKRGDLDDKRLGGWVVGKGRKTRFVAFDQTAWSSIQAYLTLRNDENLGVKINNLPLFCQHQHKTKPGERFPLTTRAVQQLIEGLAQKAGITRRVSCHSFRHYFADSLLSFTGNLALVQEAMGHQDPKTTRVYTSVKVDDIAAKVRAMGEAKR